MNLLIVHLHDMGRYCSPYGFAAPTPCMQAFAERATIFRNAHCAAPTCSPSRAALLTGQTAHQAGMLGLLHRGFDLQDYRQHLGSFLGQSGYETVYAGVQHEFRPDGEQRAPYDRKLEPVSKEGSRDQQAARATVEYLAQSHDKPFFLWTGFFLPHRPFLKSAEGKRNPDHLQPPAPLPDTPEIRQDMADYLESVEHADRCFGRVMEALEANGLREETIVVLTTDHGIPFPEMKCNLTQHGTGVALLMDFPGNLLRGRALDALVSHLDVFPSLCEWLDLPPPDHLIGRSLGPLFREEAKEIREDTFAEVNFHASKEVMRSVRTSRYNLIRIFDEDAHVAIPNIDPGPSKAKLMECGLSRAKDRERVQLYDLVFDPQERHNVAKDPAYADVLAGMERRLAKWMEDSGDLVLLGPVAAPEGAVVNLRDDLDP
jgi:arylsulfatase A-like enzyme